LFFDDINDFSLFVVMNEKQADDSQNEKANKHRRVQIKHQGHAANPDHSCGVEHEA
jgi:hypothetical protein